MTRAIRAALVAVLLVLMASPAPGSAQEASATSAESPAGLPPDPAPAPPTPAGDGQSGPTPDPDAADPGTHVGPGADLGPGGAGGEGPGAADPAPTDPAPAPGGPAPGDPAPADPAPADPAPADPAPADPATGDPGQDVQGAPAAPRQAARLHLSRAEVLPGETVTVTVTGAACTGGRIAAVWDGRDVADLVRRDGLADGVLTVPADAAPGSSVVEGWCVVGDWRQPLGAATLTVLDPAPLAPAGGPGAAPADPAPPADDPQAAAPPAAAPAPEPGPPATRPRRDTTTLRLLEPAPARPPEPVGTFGPVARSVFARTLPSLGAAFAPGPRLLANAAATLGIVALLALVAARTGRRGVRAAPGIVDATTVGGPGWRWPLPWRPPDVEPRAPLLVVALVAVVATLLYGLLDRVEERVAGAALAAAAGLLVALTVTTLAAVLPGALYAHAVPRERVALRVRPAGLAVAAVLVVGSLLAGFEPGAVHGVLAAAVVLDGRRPRPADAGRAVLLGLACLAAVTAVAWTWWSVAVDPLVDPATVTFPTMLADAALSATVVVGLQGLALGLLPLPGLDGARLAAWSRAAWAAAAAPAVFLFVHVLVNPDPTTVERTGPASPTVLIALAVAAAALWVATRAATRLRTRRLA